MIERTPPDFMVQVAVEAARLGPCQKSRRGAAVFDPEYPRHRWTTAYNSQPPQPPQSHGQCTGSELCRRDCGKLCMHAEERAIIQGMGRFGNLAHFELVHVKVSAGGGLVGGGGPSCWQCSRTILDVGIAGVYLFELVMPTVPEALPATVWRYYPALEFHQRTLAHEGLGDAR